MASESLSFGVFSFKRKGRKAMYQASQAFHTAVANGAHQIALLIFSDAVFTNDDINVTNGIEFNDYFNTEEDLTIGQALSNEISFNLFNDNKLLNSYGFGDFLATIGAQIMSTSVSSTSYIHVESRTHSYTISNTAPYLLRDNVPVSTQPAAKIMSALMYDGTLYCRMINGSICAYNDSDGSVVNLTANSFMRAQMAKWDAEGIYFGPVENGGNNMLKIWRGETLRVYEFVPLGWFTAERPNVPDVIEISMTCYDLMQRFEIDMVDAATLATADGNSGFAYPCTIQALYTAICNYVGLPRKIPDTFINGSAIITKEPEEFSKATMREVLQWIAEAACSVARIDRDGYVVLDWLRSTSKVIDEGGYSEFSPYWYETSQVTKLCNRATSGDYDYYTGSGDEAYLIQDNPLLKGVSS